MIGGKRRGDQQVGRDSAVRLPVIPGKNLVKTFLGSLGKTLLLNTSPSRRVTANFNDKTKKEKLARDFYPTKQASSLIKV